MVFGAELRNYVLTESRRLCPLTTYCSQLILSRKQFVNCEKRENSFCYAKSRAVATCCLVVLLSRGLVVLQSAKHNTTPSFQNIPSILSLPLYHIIYRCRQYPPGRNEKRKPIKTSIQSAIHTLSTFFTHLHNSTHRHPLPPLYFLYFLYFLYPLYQSPSTHSILLNSVSFITLTAYTHYGLVLQRYEHPKSHFTLLSTFVPFCPLFVCKKLSYNRCFLDYETARPRDYEWPLSVVCCLGAALTLSINPQKFRDFVNPYVLYIQPVTAPTIVCCLGAVLTLSIDPQKFRDSIIPQFQKRRRLVSTSVLHHTSIPLKYTLQGIRGDTVVRRG